MIVHGRENVFSCGWDNLRRGGALPLSPDFCGVDRHHRRLVGAEVGDRAPGFVISIDHEALTIDAERRGAKGFPGETEAVG
jgi:hypothetical protein